MFFLVEIFEGCLVIFSQHNHQIAVLSCVGLLRDDHVAIQNPVLNQAVTFDLEFRFTFDR